MYPHQAERLTRTLESRGLAALVATSVENVAYVTGFRSLTKEVYRTPSFAVFAPGGTALVVPAVDLSAIVADAVAVDHVVASRAVLPPQGGFIAYTVSKAAVITLTQALAQEVKGHRITVNAVLPSTMDTPANRRAMPDADRSGWVSTQDVANVVAFLLSERAAAVTGAAVPV